jgi:Na+-translocating ferredoxin:NAD+ oxidoreductase RnfG subunit
MVNTFVFMESCDSEKTTLNQEQDPDIANMLMEIFPEFGYYSYNEELEFYTVYDNSPKQIGYAFYAEGRGQSVTGYEAGEKFPNPIIVLVGLEDRETIKGIYVVSQGETFEYWIKLIERNYFEQFKGLKIQDAYLKRFGGTVDSVSGATLSSTSVLDIVREAVLSKASILPENALAPKQRIPMEWQIKLMLSMVIPIVIIPVIWLWFVIIKK